MNKQIATLEVKRIKGLFYSEMYGKKLFNFGLSGIKSFFRGLTDTAWGVAGLISLNIAMLYMKEKYNQDITYINITLLRLDTWVIEHIMLFFFTLWLYSWIIHYRSIKYD